MSLHTLNELVESFQNHLPPAPTDDHTGVPGASVPDSEEPPLARQALELVLAMVHEPEI